MARGRTRCKIDIEENSKCVYCCKYCKDFKKKLCKYESMCIFAKRNMDCNNEIRTVETK